MKQANPSDDCEPELKPRPAHRIWRRIGRPLFLLMLVVWGVRLTIADWRDIATGSMMPVIQPGDRILVNLLAYDFRIPLTDVVLWQWSEPSRGDVVVFHLNDTKQTMVKRVIGLPGDEIRVVGHAVYINGDRAAYDVGSVLHAVSEERYAGDGAPLIAVSENTGDHRHTVLMSSLPAALEPFSVTVPDGHVLVLGDNRMHSFDSRDIGTVPIRSVLGQVYAVGMSIDPERTLGVRGDRWFVSVH